jgi:intein/homing endonuclease
MTKMVQSPTYNYIMNERTGLFKRWGKDLDDNPQYSPIGNEILDLEVSTICHQGCKFCFTAGTLVRAKDGYKNIEELKKYDLVYSYNAEKSIIENDKITEVMNRNIDEEIIEITLENDEKIYVTKEHPFFLKNEWVMAKNLINGDNLFIYDKDMPDMQ